MVSHHQCKPFLRLSAHNKSYRYEVQELMKVIDKYVKQNPAEKENKTLERFFDLLDVMDMEW